MNFQHHWPLRELTFLLSEIVPNLRVRKTIVASRLGVRLTLGCLNILIKKRASHLMEMEPSLLTVGAPRYCGRDRAVRVGLLRREAARDVGTPTCFETVNVVGSVILCPGKTMFIIVVESIHLESARRGFKSQAHHSVALKS